MNCSAAPYRMSILVLSSAVAVFGCERVKSSTPLSPSIAGPIAGVSITTPPPLVPAVGQKIKNAEQPITMRFGNAETNSVRPYTVTVQLAADAIFAGIAYTQTGIAPSADGQNRIVLPGRLPAGRVYYWRTRAEDGANTSDWSDPVAFEVLEDIVIGVPVPLSPIGNTRVTSTAIQLRVRNGTSTGPYGPLGYYFQASRDAAFASLLVNDWVAQGSGETVFNMTSPAPDVVVFWRSSIADSTTAGAWSVIETFRTPLPIVVPPPPPPPPGGNCVSSSPEAIVTCERNKYAGKMSDGQMLDFMKATAKSLNANGISGGPFGILRKTSGNQCGGYSCDIVCSGNGNGQQQWDVLGDIDNAQVPGWNGPKVVPNIRVDLCTVP